jgi:hypothetical protein
MTLVKPEERKRAFRKRRPAKRIKQELGVAPKRPYKVPINSPKRQFLVTWKKKKGEERTQVYPTLVRFIEVNPAWSYNACQKQIMKKEFYEDKIIKINRIKFVK